MTLRIGLMSQFCLAWSFFCGNKLCLNQLTWNTQDRFRLYNDALPVLFWVVNTSEGNADACLPKAKVSQNLLNFSLQIAVSNKFQSNYLTIDVLHSSIYSVSVFHTLSNVGLQYWPAPYTLSITQMDAEECGRFHIYCYVLLRSQKPTVSDLEVFGNNILSYVWSVIVLIPE